MTRHEYDHSNSSPQETIGVRLGKLAANGLKSKLEVNCQERIKKYWNQLERLEYFNPAAARRGQSSAIDSHNFKGNSLRKSSNFSYKFAMKRSRDHIFKSICGRRPIIIDGSNVAHEIHGRSLFDSRSIAVAVNYFLRREFSDITVVVPERVLHSRYCKDPHILFSLKKQGILLTSWSRQLPNGGWIDSYDDRMIVKIAHTRGGIIVSNDRFRDLYKENCKWRATISQRVLGFRFMPRRTDKIMFPCDPFGRYGPTLKEFLRF